jgi:hypothetical protein
MQIPAHILARMQQPSKLNESLLKGLGSESIPRISIKGSRFRIIEEGTETVLNSLTLDCVIVGANEGLSKVFYEKPWDPTTEITAGQGEQPDCFSMNGIVPDPASTKQQNDVCATCPMNAWGSKVTPQGQEVKACADQKRIAVVSASAVDGTVYLLQVTPSALKNLREFRNQLAQHNLNPETIITRLGFDTKASHPKLTFALGGFLTEEQLKIVDKRVGSEEVKQVTDGLPRTAVTPKVVAQATSEIPRPGAPVMQIQSQVAPRRGRPPIVREPVKTPAPEIDVEDLKTELEKGVAEILGDMDD